MSLDFSWVQDLGIQSRYQNTQHNLLIKVCEIKHDMPHGFFLLWIATHITRLEQLYLYCYADFDFPLPTTPRK